jgi:LacI family transcriptional regulator
MPKEITIYDLAKALNLSAATVSRGLNKNENVNSRTAERILAKAAEMGYRPNNFASNLRNMKTQTVGVIVPRLNSNFMSSAIAGMEIVASKENYKLIIAQSLESFEKEKDNVRIMYNNRVDGLLISLAYNTKNIFHLQPFFSKKIPVVFFDRAFASDENLSVVIDNYKASYKVTSHLLEQGCKRIMHIGGSMLRELYSNRLKGYKDALEEYNISFDPSLLYLCDLTEEAGTEAAAYILNLKKSKRPDAVFSANDTAAVHCMLRLKENGINIPDEIAFAGFNNDPISKVIVPNLTTVNYSGYNIGKEAATNVLNIIKGENTCSAVKKIILQSELIIRNSSLKIK